VHRIDKNTSGVLVVAKDEVAREGLKAQLSAHTVERVYRAITVGVPPQNRIETLHGRSSASRLRFTTHVERGKRAVTYVTLEEVLAGGAAALVACRLETGRTHQIRVHLSECTNTPIFADSLYGGMPKDARLIGPAKALGRQALHAGVLGFEHPVTGQRLRFDVPMPDDMTRCVRALRAL
jgi:23S rRNA pseudouridine1911/1915/1917 synthase